MSQNRRGVKKRSSDVLVQPEAFQGEYGSSCGCRNAISCYEDFKMTSNKPLLITCGLPYAN
ncbi:MAG: hypothetical protein ACXVH8_06060, partial [Halobacteriota archaeon]